jgi:hypothetical protein
MELAIGWAIVLAVTRIALPLILTLLIGRALVGLEHRSAA